MRFGRVLLVGGLLAALSLSGAVSPASALTNDEKAKIVEAVKKRPPIEFVVVKGAPNACGPGCDSWIAAEGSIDADAAARLRHVLEKLGKLKLPIYFNSQGGNLLQGLEIGRMLRARGMTASVARTLPAKCLSKRTPDWCAGLISAIPESEAVLWTYNARCVSACALAFFGAANREVAPNALLGVHSTFVYFAHPPRRATQSQLDRASEKGMQRLENMLSSYVAEMKLSKELFKLIWNTKFEDMHYLTRAELLELGIDRRAQMRAASAATSVPASVDKAALDVGEPPDSGWRFALLPVVSIGSTAFTRTATTGSDQIVLAISCAGSNAYTISTVQRLPNSSATPKYDILIGDASLRISLPVTASSLKIWKGDPYDVRQSEWSRSVVEKLLASSTIPVRETPKLVDVRIEADKTKGAPLVRTSEALAAQYSISTKGAQDAFKALSDQCAKLN